MPLGKLLSSASDAALAHSSSMAFELHGLQNARPWVLTGRFEERPDRAKEAGAQKAPAVALDVMRGDRGIGLGLEQLQQLLRAGPGAILGNALERNVRRVPELQQMSMSHAGMRWSANPFCMQL